MLLGASYPPLHPLVLPFLGLVPLGVWLERVRDDPAAARRGGTFFGIVYFGVMLWWILPALLTVSLLAVPAFLAGLVLLGALTGFFVGLLRAAVVDRAAPMWLSLPVIWTAFEWTLAHLPDTLAFPWLGLGTTLTGFPELAGIAELVGARGVTFWVALVNGLVAHAVLATRAGGSWRAPAVATAFVVALPMGWGVWRARTLPLLEVGTLAVVQPNVPLAERRGADRGRERMLDALDRLATGVEPGEASLVVLPEMVFLEPTGPADRDRIQGLSRELGAPVVFGAAGVEPSGALPTNSVWLMGPQGAVDWRYDKHRLVPVVERAPFLPDALLSGRPGLGGWAAGTERRLLEAGGAGYGVLVCYESAFADEARAWRRAGADVLLNLTNDGWFGSGSVRTTALWQHPAHLVMRAIELRVGVARAANTGISMFVEPTGRVRSATALDVEDVRVAVVTTTDVETLYARWGDLIGPACALAALALLLAGRGATRRRGEPVAGG